MRVAENVILTASQKATLEKYVKSNTTPVRLHERSRIILMAAEGFNNKYIAEEMAICKNKVGRCRKRFIEGGIAGISKDKPRGSNQGGKSSLEQAVIRKRIIEKTTQEKPRDATHWSIRTLAKELNTTRSFVQRVWKSVGLKPHLEKTFKVSNDKSFE